MNNKTITTVRRRSRHLTQRVFLIFLWLVTSVAILAPSSTFGAARAESPPSLGGPTPVFVDLWGILIFDIDSQNQTYSLEAILDADWHDPRLAFDASSAGTDILTFEGDAATELLKNEIWWPNFDIDDSKGPRERINLMVQIHSNGNVSYSERFIAEIYQDYDLENFPFDRQFISFRVSPFSQDVSIVEFYPSEVAGATLAWEPNEWLIYDSELVIENDGFAYARVDLMMDRVPDYYLTNFILPMMLIVLISSAVFYMGFETTHLGDRLGVSFTSVLTVVAFDFVASEGLPKLWYSTGLDNILTTAYVFLALNVLENVVAARLYESRPKAANRLDKAFRWLFPIVYLLTVFYMIGSIMPAE